MSNQTAELLALIHGVTLGEDLIGEESFIRLVNASDSAYACGGVTSWIYKWRETNYKGVQNATLFKRLDQIIDGSNVCIQFWKIEREKNMDADSLAKQALEEEEKRMEMLRMRWQTWLEDEWYGDVVSYLLFKVPSTNLGSNRQFEKLKRDSKRFALMDNDGGVRLIYHETDGSRSCCMPQSQVVRILHRFHDNHGHFSVGIMSRNMLGRYYWPDRLQDIAKWCLSCEVCQQMGHRRNSTQIKPISSLQPMDLLGMDFLGPITPNSRSGSVYVLLVVDYFSRYLFAYATTSSTGAAVVEFVQRITRTFGWPLAFYVDNRSHFVKGDFPKVLKQAGTRLLTAPITNPRSVGLAERYVQLILAGLWARVAAEARKKDDMDSMGRWDKYLDSVVYAFNTRVLRVHGYTP